MHGFLNVLKPPGMTSFDVVAYARKRLGTRKVGHLGTLDPDAAGVLPLACGSATRLIEHLPSDPKLYRAEILLGVSTDTQDTSGAITAERPWSHVTEALLRQAMGRFAGRIMQKPPLYSAVHHEGERLYDLARRGVCVDVPARPVEVHSLELLDFSAPRALLDVSCGPGTYVRALAHDLGEALGCGAALSFLVRLASGPFTVDEALLLDEVAPAALLPLEWPLGHLRGIFLDDKMMRLFVNGCRIASDKFEMEKGPQAPGVYKVYSPVKDFLGLGEMIPGRPLCLAPLKILSGRI